MRRAGSMTLQRKTIYDILSESDDHPTAADIIGKLNARGYQFAYATVYNTLRYLTDEGLIHELKLEGGPCRYDARTDDHLHVVCVRCGRVDEAYFGAPAEWVASVARSTGYDICEEQIMFKGACGACQSSSRPSN